MNRELFSPFPLLRIGAASLAAVLLQVCAVELAAEDPPAFELTVSSGKHPRRNTPVSAALPGKFQNLKALRLVEVTGGLKRDIPVQIESGTPARFHFILDGETAAGGERAYRAYAADSPPAASGWVSVDGEIEKHYLLKYGGKSVLQYNHAMVPPPAPGIPKVQTRNAYIHPVWTPAGRIVTMDYPRNHLHHRGIWFPWTKTEFEGRHPDFWNLGDGTGTVVYDGTDRVVSGPVFGGFRVRHRHVDLSAPGGGKDALREVWDVKIYAAGAADGYFLFDLESVQECAGESPLKLPEYRYGGLGFRGSLDWEGDNVEFLTSEGKTRKDGHGTRARWCSVSGKVGGEPAGIVFFCHPSNYRAPQPMRIHPSEPFFNFAPVQAGEMEITPGKPYVSRYRFLVHDGKPSVEEAERHWRDYADPPVVAIKP